MILTRSAATLSVMSVTTIDRQAKSYPSFFLGGVEKIWKGGFLMSALQDQAVRMVQELSDDDAQFVIEFIKRIAPQKNRELSPEERQRRAEEKQRAFLRLEETRKRMQKYFPDDFDPERELAEAREERYGRIS